MRPRLGTTLAAIATVGALGVAGITAAAVASPGSSVSLTTPIGSKTSVSDTAPEVSDTPTKKTKKSDRRHYFHGWSGYGHGWTGHGHGPGWLGWDDDDWFGSSGFHGEATVETDDGYQRVAGQHGEVTHVSGDAITVKSDDGYEATYSVDKDTELWKDGDECELGDFKTGTDVWVAAIIDGDTRLADHIATP